MAVLGVLIAAVLVISVDALRSRRRWVSAARAVTSGPEADRAAGVRALATLPTSQLVDLALYLIHHDPSPEVHAALVDAIGSSQRVTSASSPAAVEIKLWARAAAA